MKQNKGIKKKFFVYEDKNKQLKLFLKKLTKENEKKKEFTFIKCIPFHPVVLNNFLKQENKSYGERFEICYRFFKYSIKE